MTAPTTVPCRRRPVADVLPGEWVWTPGDGGWFQHIDATVRTVDGTRITLVGADVTLTYDPTVPHDRHVWVACDAAAQAWNRQRISGWASPLADLAVEWGAA